MASARNASRSRWTCSRQAITAATFSISGLMRPIFSPTEYIQIKGRGTRRYTFKIGHTEYEKKNYFLLDFCGVAEYFEEKYDYSVPLAVPRERTTARPEP